MENEDPGPRLFTSLVELFKPHVAAVTIPKIEKWARSPYGFEETKVLFLFLLLTPFRLVLRAAGQEGKHLQSIAGMFGEALKAIFRLPRFSRKQVEANSERWLAESTASFVRGWLAALHAVAPIGDTEAFDLGRLDDAMLPGRANRDSAAIIRVYGGEQLSSEEILAVLRAVKASLPFGQRLPPQALEIMTIERRLFH